ncbi:ABC transporter permease [Mycolicibacterium aichiense]|uniref:Transport permease protein n=1 Tax=Mycolicibacterium aichiense TaxID=1799 RepID=A0AAD1HR87_9MYCO|nr:ABC transporter permease [Mycolicibacterium aichiense]MCV7019257.1 ABC transporter permease [Mycolicibacterium aichiense]BBX09173.1 transport permease protein [Mycolicibacterium aichiense]SUA13744.1 ABC-type multidrug transport system, permease component [Mycolicibacterium aichiense]
MKVPAAPRSSLLYESWVFACQHFIHWRRSPLVPIQSLVFPTFLLITYYLLVGKSVLRITGSDSLYGLVPTCAIAGAFSGALAVGLSMSFERDSGLLSRLWALPVNRASALTGRLIAEAVRTLVSTAFITAVGIGLGLRFRGGPLELLLYLLVPVMVVVVFAMAVIAIAVRAKDGTTLIWLGLPAITAVFASSGSPPVESLPSWMWPLLRFQPMEPIVESMRTLAQGGVPGWPLLWGALWTIAGTAVVGPLAVRGYRKATESGGIRG